MNLQTEFLRTFLAVYETGGFTKAGLRVNRSQSAVSMQIKRLEGETGKPLFVREGKSITPTPEGEVLATHARRIIKEHDDAVKALSRPGLEGRIRFATPELYTTGLLPGLLASFAAAHPNVRVEMTCENSEAIFRGIASGRFDLGLCTQTDEQGQLVHRYPIVWAVNQGFKMPDNTPLSLALYEDDCIFRDWTLAALEKAKIDYRIVYVSRSTSGILDAVRAGFAIAPIISSNLPPDIATAGMEKGLPTLPVCSIVLVRPPGPSPEVVEYFAEQLINEFRLKS